MIVTESFSDYAKTKKFIVNLGLERISLLLDLLGNPQDKIKVIHVAGTNGKGSVCAFLKSILMSAGFKTGLYSSPELVDINERISINGENITDEELSDIFTRIELASKKVLNALGTPPSPYEIWTAAAYLYFYEQHCDIAIVEACMGGLTDATNVIKAPVLSVITRLSLDHTAYLGNSLSDIAYYKCGIIKPYCPTVTARQEESAMAVVRKTAEEKNSPLYITDPIPTIKMGTREKLVDYDILLGLSGINQAENAALALQCARLLNIDKKFIAQGLQNAVHKGRFEFLSQNPTVIFDGAHNPDGALSLALNLTRYFGEEKFTVVYAAMADKEIQKIINILSKKADEFIFTSVSGNERSAQKADFDKINLSVKASYYQTLSEALDYAKTTNRNIIITGSLYLYKDLP